MRRQLVEVDIPVGLYHFLVIDVELFVWVDGYQDRADVSLKQKLLDDWTAGSKDRNL